VTLTPRRSTVTRHHPPTALTQRGEDHAPVKLSASSIKSCTAEVKPPDADIIEDAKALSESFFSQLGPGSNFGSQFAQTVTVKCGDAPS
jgi:hypothetical protein